MKIASFSGSMEAERLLVTPLTDKREGIHKELKAVKGKMIIYTTSRRS